MAYTVNTSAGDGTTISPTSQQVESGKTASFAITLHAGYSNLQVTGANGSLNGSTYTTGPISGNATVTASATKNPTTFTVSVVAGAGTTASANSVQVQAGQMGSVSVGLASGYQNLVASGLNATIANGVCTFGPVNADGTVTLSASPILPAVFTVSIVAGTGTTTSANSVQVQAGQMGSVSVGLASGYQNLVATGLNATIANGVCTFGPVNADGTVTLSASPILPAVFTVSIVADAGTTASANSVQVQAGQMGSVNVGLAPGYQNLVASGLNATISNGVCTFGPVNANGTVTLSATPIYTVSIVADAGTTASANSVQVQAGQMGSVNVGLAPGYQNLVASGLNATINNGVCTFGPVNTNGTVTLSATPIPPAVFTVSVVAGAGTTATANSVQVQAGQMGSVSVGLASGYQNLVATGLNATIANGVCTFGPVNADGTVTLSASPIPPSHCTLTATWDGGLSVFPAKVTVPYGTPVTFHVSVGNQHVLQSVDSPLKGRIHLSEYEVEAATSDATLHFVSARNTDPAYALKNIKVTPNAVFADECTTTPFIVEAYTSGTGFAPPKLHVSIPSSTMPGGGRELVITLVDDGTRGDRVAGDGVYTASFSLGGSAPFLSQFDHTVDHLNCWLEVVDASGNPVYSTSTCSENVWIGVVDRGKEVALTKVTDELSVGPNMVNLVVPDMNAYADLSQYVIHRMAALFPPQFDTICWYTVGNTNDTNWPTSLQVVSDVRGLGRELFGWSGAYGGSKALRSIINMHWDIVSQCFLHELGHSWAFYLNNPSLPLCMPGGAHPRSLTTQRGQMSYQQLFLVEQPNGDFLVTWWPEEDFWGAASYSLTELYLFGLAPVNEVNDEWYYLGDASTVKVGDILPRASVTRVTGADIVRVYGPREPAYDPAKTNVRVAFVAVSERPLTPAEASVINRAAEFFASTSEGHDPMPDDPVHHRSIPSFWGATGHRGTLTTAIPAPK